MDKAKVPDYGMVDFDPTTNSCDLYTIVICDWENEEFLEEEHYTTESEYRSALLDTDGREVMGEDTLTDFRDVYYNYERCWCECFDHVAYVVDHEE